MTTKPLFSAAGLLLLALMLMAVPAGAADFSAPIDTRLTLQTTPSTGGGHAVAWTGLPKSYSGPAELTIFVQREGGGQRQLLRRSLTLASGRVATASCTLPSMAPGTFKLMSLITMRVAGGQHAKADSVRFSVGSDRKLRLLKEPVLSARQFEERLRPRLPEAGLTKKMTAEKPDLSGFQVRGRLMFADIIHNASHTTQSVNVSMTTATTPIRGIKLQICDLLSYSSFMYYQILGTVYPDDNGYFQFYVPSNDDGDGTGRDIFLRLIADSTYGKVTDFSGATYAHVFLPPMVGHTIADYASIDWLGGTMDLNTIIALKDAAGLWNIMDAARTGHLMVKAQGVTPPKAVFRWAKGNSDGSYFRFDNKMITLRGDDANPDEFDDGVILHEYGHFIANTFSYDKNPGGTHYFDQPSTRTLAWSEGWATFFSCAARNSRFIIDTMTKGQNVGLAIDLESFTDIFDFDWRRGDDVEACVAAVLWDVFDAESDYGDTLSSGFNRIWSIVDTYFTASHGCTFRDFYDAWDNYDYPSISSLRAIMKVFGIGYWRTLMVNSMLINNGQSLAPSRKVTLNNVTAGAATEYMASESPTFTRARWRPFTAKPIFTLSQGDGFKRVFFKVRNTAGQIATAKFDWIELKEQHPLTIDGASWTDMAPNSIDFNWYKMNVPKQQRILIKTTPPLATRVVVHVYRADNLDDPLFYAGYDDANPIPDINEIFPAGDYVVVVYSYDDEETEPLPGSDNAADFLYTIRAMSYYWR